MGLGFPRRAVPALMVAACALAAPSAVAAEDIFKQFRALAEKVEAGDLDSKVRLAVKFEHAEGVPRDYAKAIKLYCEAARGGHSGAAFNLGWIYAYGRGVTRDDDRAAAWFRRAAQLGHGHAQRILKLVHGKSNAPALCPGETAAPITASVAPPAAIAKLVKKLAPEHDLDPKLVLAVIQIESAFRADAVSHKNAQGLMQLIPETAKRFGVRDVFDPVQNVTGGMKYLRWLLDRFDGNIELALAGYNAGENAVERYEGVPPYPETQNYLRKFGEIGILPRRTTRTGKEKTS